VIYIHHDAPSSLFLPDDWLTSEEREKKKREQIQHQMIQGSFCKQMPTLPSSAITHQQKQHQNQQSPTLILQQLHQDPSPETQPDGAIHHDISIPDNENVPIQAQNDVMQ
jgi:hypothetical protein